MGDQEEESGEEGISSLMVSLSLKEKIFNVGYMQDSSIVDAALEKICKTKSTCQ